MRKYIKVFGKIPYSSPDAFVKERRLAKLRYSFVRFSNSSADSRIWSEDQAQDIAEYAVMLAVILVLVVGTLRLIGSNANTAFSSAASSIQ